MVVEVFGGVCMGRAGNFDLNNSFLFDKKYLQQALTFELVHTASYDCKRVVLHYPASGAFRNIARWCPFPLPATLTDREGVFR
jgi:hypothetical protein